eukprot:gene2700-12560_t
MACPSAPSANNSNSGSHFRLTTALSLLSGAFKTFREITNDNNEAPDVSRRKLADAEELWQTTGLLG